MVWTDPPYGHSNNDGDLNAALSTGTIDGRTYRSPVAIANDDADSMREVVDAALSEAARVLKRASSSCCCCCGGGGDK
jgi:L-aminopeptidase/D-esterase-like protein